MIGQLLKRSVLPVVFLITTSTYAQLFDISAKDVLKIKDRTLIVVLQEEKSELVNRYKKDAVKLARYKGMIQYANTLLIASVTKHWRASKPIVYKTFSDCLLLADTSVAYYLLEFSSLRVADNTQLQLLKVDTTDVYGPRKELMRRKEIGYFELRFIEKIKSTAFHTFYTPSSVPNELDFTAAVQFISGLVHEELSEPKRSSRDKELSIQQANARLSTKKLLVDSASVNKNWKNFNFIKTEYDSGSVYQLTDSKGLAEAINNQEDTTLAYLVIVPYIDPIARGNAYMGTTGGSINEYEKVVYYMQLIFVAYSGELLYYDKTEENVVLVKDWKRFQRYSRESTFTIPIQRTNNPGPPQGAYPQNH